MPELRKDPVTGDWVIIAKERSKRPHDFTSPSKTVTQGQNCVFCYGNEDKTPPEVYAVRPDGSKPNQPGWLVRAFPNKFPAVVPSTQPAGTGTEVENGFTAVGIHEVVVDTYNHSDSFSSVTDAQAELVLLALADRCKKLYGDPSVQYVQVFKNHGPTAGASLEHSHWQIITVPVIPEVFRRESACAESYYKQNGKCVYCQMVSDEIKVAERVIQDGRDFVAFAPYASRLPGEVWVVPKKHSPQFTNLPMQGIKGFGRFLKQTVVRLEKAFNSPPYNIVISSCPPQFQNDAYHWHVKITPRLSIIAGFELGTGIFINPTPPEISAAAMREVVNEVIEP